MNEINKPQCGQANSNTGVPECDFLPGRVIGIILTGKGKEYSGEETSDLIETLKKAAQGSVKDRVYPIFRFGTITDNSEDPATESLGIGYTKTLNDGAYNWTFPLVNGTACYAANLRKFNGDKYNAFLVLDNGLAGVKTKSGGVRGFTMSQFYVTKPVWAGDTTITRYNVTISFPNPSEFVDSLAYVQTTDNIEYEIRGNRECEMIQKSATAESVTVDIVNKCSGQSILSVYGDELADESLWGQGVAVTAVALASGLLKFTGTFKNGDKIAPVGVAELATAGVGGSPEYGIEITPLTVKIP